MANVLTSDLFSADAKLEAAAVSDPAHIVKWARGAHVRKIQTALNLLDEADLAIDGIFGDLTAAAVLRFKRRRDIVARPRQQQADDIVGQRTIRALDEKMRAYEQNPPKPFFTTVRSINPMHGDIDLQGFSRARLERAPGADWTRRNPRLPLCQMIPLGGTRTVEFIVFGLYDPSEINFEFDGLGVCALDAVSASQSDAGEGVYKTTLRGLVPAETNLFLRRGAKRVLQLRLIVRAPASLTLDTIHLGPVAQPGDDTFILQNLIPVLNGFLTPQLNLTIRGGSSRLERRLPLNGDFANPREPDLKAPLVVLQDGETPPTDRAFVRWRDVLPLAGGSQLAAFLGPTLTDVNDKFRGISALNLRRCWIKIDQISTYSNGAAWAMILMHELAHSLGARHILAPSSRKYLMADTAGWEHVGIPAETTVEYDAGAT